MWALHEALCSGEALYRMKEVKGNGCQEEGRQEGRQEGHEEEEEVTSFFRF